MIGKLTDVNFQLLNVGDNIMYIKHNKTSTDIFKGCIVGFTPQMVNIVYINHIFNDNIHTKNTRVCPDKLIKY